MNITAKIHELREQKEWSVAKLARKSDIPTVSLRVMLSREDNNSFNVKSLIKIAKVLGVSVSYLTQSDDESNAPKITIQQKEELLKVVNDAVSKYFNVLDAEKQEDEKQEAEK